MDGARAWRATLWGVAIAHGIGLLVLLFTLGFRPFEIYAADFPHYAVAGLACALWAVEHVRRGPAPAVLALGGVALAAGFAVWSAETAGTAAQLGPHDHAPLALIWAAFTLPPALLLAHGHSREGALAALGAALVLGGVARVAWRYDATNQYAPEGPTALVQLAGCALLLAALVLSLRGPPRPLPPVRVALPASGLAGMLLLALSWWVGGQLLVVLLLWVVAPIALAAPALLAARHRPVRAAVAVAILAAGAFVPASECTYPYVTDAPQEDDPQVARVETEPVWKVAGRGPWWRSDDLFASYSVRCEPRVPALALGWLVALVAVAWVPWPDLRRAKPF